MTRKSLPHFLVRAFAALLLLAALLPAGPAARPAYAASLTVTTLTDEDTSNGSCSLREAITAANNNADHNDCTGASYGNDTITFSVSGTITLTMGILPPIVSGAGTLTIDGSGQNIIISGGGSVRVMQVNSGADLTLQNLTVANGSTGLGGGVYNLGTLTIANSTFSGNSAIYYGGGVYNLGALTLTNSTFSGNSAIYYGGGVWNNGALTITNSAFSGNSASSSGGGVYNASAGTLHYANTIIANSPSGGDCANSGTIATNTNNLVEDGSCSPSLSGDPNLGSLTGSPAYFPLLPGSPAIDAGTNSGCPATDQRGVARPQGARCDIGAYEVPFLFLPLIMKN